MAPSARVSLLPLAPPKTAAVSILHLSHAYTRTRSPLPLTLTGCIASSLRTTNTASTCTLLVCSRLAATRRARGIRAAAEALLTCGCRLRPSCLTLHTCFAFVLVSALVACVGREAVCLVDGHAQSLFPHPLGGETKRGGRYRLHWRLGAQARPLTHRRGHPALASAPQQQTPCDGRLRISPTPE